MLNLTREINNVINIKMFSHSMIEVEVELVKSSQISAICMMESNVLKKE